MNIYEFLQQPVMGILRGVHEKNIEPLVEKIVESGLKTIEITMNTDNAPELIKDTIEAAKGQLIIGAGTVTNMEDLNIALDNGASFIVSPTMIPDIVKFCVDQKIPVFPGAFTPQEIFNAWEGGATMVKVFPAKFLGAEYIKEIKGPFNDIELMACGGVSPENIKGFFECGVNAVAFGGSIFKKEWLANEEYDKIKNSIKRLLNNLPKDI